MKRQRWTSADFAGSAEDLAQRLLGNLLVRVTDEGHRLSGRIVETEAYIGIEDRASHAFEGRRTARNESMYGPPGTAYVYFTYGMHHCFNIACGRAGEPPAVLIRALEPVEGLEQMTRLRRGTRRMPTIGLRTTDLCSGPAKLCQALDIDRRLDGVDLGQSPLLSVERGLAVNGTEIATGPRVGLGPVGEWANAPLRYWIKGNPHVSR